LTTKVSVYPTPHGVNPERTASVRLTLGRWQAPNPLAGVGQHAGAVLGPAYAPNGVGSGFWRGLLAYCAAVSS